jgi:D-alanyl-D-alanine dipeptidase
MLNQDRTQNMYKYLVIVLATCINFSPVVASAPAPGFVYLDEVDPSIRSSMRYTTQDNFLGQPVDGYAASRVIMTAEAAKALSHAQAKLLSDGFSMVVYDAYRPQTAVNHFMRWSRDQQDQKMKELYYPRIDKARVFELGYVCEKSGHSRGSTIDITIIPVDEKLQEIKVSSKELADGFPIKFLDDGTVDMGSSFDLFDLASHYDSKLVSAEHFRLRTYLKDIMDACGFKNYAEEWWHFTLRNEPFPETYFDFPVK